MTTRPDEIPGGGTAPPPAPQVVTPPAPIVPPPGQPPGQPPAGTASPAPIVPPPGQPQELAPDPDDAELGISPVAGGDMVTMPRSALAKLRERGRRSGERRATSELDDAARAAGFAGGAKDAFAAIAKMAAQPPQQPAPQPVPAPAPAKPEEKHDMARKLDDKERAKRKKARQDAAAQMALKDQEIANLKAAQTARDKAEAEERSRVDMRARLSALGMSDADYGTHLVRDQFVGKTPAQIKEYIEGEGLKKWVDSQKVARPALFAPVVQAANTAPAAANGSSAPGTPPAGTPPAPAVPPPPDAQEDRLRQNMTRPRAEVDAEIAKIKAASRQAERQ